MIIRLYRYDGEREVVDKTSSLTLLDEISGTLKETCDITTPVILLRINDDLSGESTYRVTDSDGLIITDDESARVGATFNNNVPIANYAFIVEFNRWYFINEVVSELNGLWRLTMEIDVLMTYRSTIRQQTALVTRNEFTYDLQMEDQNMTYLYDDVIDEYEPADGEAVNVTFSATITAQNIDNFVVNVVNEVGYAPTGVYGAPVASLHDVSTNQFFAKGASTPYVMNFVDVGLVREWANGEAQSALAQNMIKSIIAYPFSVEKSNILTDVYLGSANDQSHYVKYQEGQSMVTLKCALAKSSCSGYLVAGDFVVPENHHSYLDYEPYTHYELYVPFLGWVTLSARNVVGHRLLVYYNTNYEDGSATAYVYDATDDKIIHSATCQLGVRIAFSVTNNQQLTNQRNANNINLGLGLISSALAIGGGIATGNPIAIGAGALTGVKTVTGFINTNANLFENAQASFSSGMASLFSGLKCRLRITSKVPSVNDTAQYAHLHGLPLYQMKTLSQLTGFTMVGDCHLHGFGTALANEVQRISALLKSGIIL